MIFDADNENKKLLLNTLDSTFFRSWKEGREDNYDKLEIQVNAECDLKCSYCYYHKNKEILNPSKITDHKTLMDNLKILLSFLEDNALKPQIELFSGELFSQRIGYKIVDYIIEWQIRNSITNNIIIPSNFNFMHIDKRVSSIESLLQKAIDNGFMVILSCSIDGKYCDSNRPYRNCGMELKRTDEWYDKVFAFCAKWGFSFHPMIWKENIDKWIKNFQWFQYMLDRHNIPSWCIYLLEVRNDGWDEESCGELYKFIRYLVDWLYTKYSSSPSTFGENVCFTKKGMNLFSSLSSCGRGIGCSIQSTMQLRLGDLTVTPCHRLAYDHLNYYSFVVEDDRIVDIDPKNIGLMFGINTTTYKNFPYCQDCMINDLCSGGCLGSQYESMDDPFIPIPSVCGMIHAKQRAIMDGLVDNESLPYIMGMINEKKRSNIINILNM